MTDEHVPEEPDAFFAELHSVIGEGKGYKELADKNEDLARKVHIEFCRTMISFYIKGQQTLLGIAIKQSDEQTADKILSNSLSLLTVALSLMGDAENADPRFFPWKEQESSADDDTSDSDSNFGSMLKALYKNNNNN